jgi:hypothetical protein
MINRLITTREKSFIVHTQEMIFAELVLMSGKIFGCVAKSDRMQQQPQSQSQQQQ